MLISLVNMGMGITDATMVSAMYGTEAFAAVAVGSDLYSIIFYLGAGIVAGVAPFYSAAVARNECLERARLHRSGWLVVSGVAALTMPIVWTAPNWLALAELDAELLDAGRGYTRAMALTLVPMLGVALYRTVLTSAERPRLFLYVTLSMLPLNAAANYIFMAGLAPVPSLGPTGAGVSSLLVASATLGVLSAIHRRVRKPLPPGRAWPSRAEVTSVLRVGLPIGIASVGEVGIFLVATLYAARLGAGDVAAHTLTLRAAGFAYAIPAALLQASLVRMARAESVADRATTRAVAAGSVGLSLAAGIFLCLTLALAASPLAAAFFDTTPTGAAAASLATGLLLLLAVLELFGTPGSAATGLLRGQKDARAPMTYSLFGQWVVGAPVGVLLCEVGGLGVTGLWLGLVTGTAVASLLTIRRLTASR
ncbi:MATE family efflux transporter [Albidovulum aquaemixtae]|nr:MATE family efflux transporter [Defluviimonas aquaemixtae]